MNVRDEIARLLSEIEAREGVRVLYACESGSRAWGFPSTDSDYDVRFFYLRPVNWYLSVTKGRDVIEGDPKSLLDVSGWDLQKTLQLLYKSNPPLLEWLRSPIVYRETSPVAMWLRKCAKQYFSPRSTIHHYLHMADGNFREYLRGEEVRLKKYFYVLRPLLACGWIERTGEMAPMEFNALVESELPDGELKDEIHSLLDRKIQGQELDRGPRIAVINDYVEERINHFRALAGTAEHPKVTLDALDRLFQSALREVYGYSHEG